jgi:Family of unknown function (DUF6516)
MAVKKTVDDRHNTKGGGIIRLEAWQDTKTKQVVRYSMTYINRKVCSVDNGRVLGFDNSHRYPGFATAHHCHWFGRVYENRKFVSHEATVLRFQRFLKRFKSTLKKAY